MIGALLELRAWSHTESAALMMVRIIKAFSK
jgi:hypothetical protein